jgi:hypothetical protein
MGGYAPLPVPPAYQGPSGQVGQILLDGIVSRVSLFHDSSDDELDWHVYIDPHPSDWPVRMYCELMVVDKREFFGPSGVFDKRFFSADVTLPFHLSRPGSEHPAWDLSLLAQADQGENKTFSEFSRLVGGRAYLQGPYVNDENHDTLVEIHPLDSIAFAMDESESPLSSKWGLIGWPVSFVRWRIAVFTNSTFHRIADEDYLNHPRMTTWLLDLPGLANPGSHGVHSTFALPVAIDVEQQPLQLWNGDTETFYGSRGVTSISQPEITVDPRDGRKKLKVSVVMAEPGELGGIIVRDYLIRVRRQDPPVLG